MSATRLEKHENGTVLMEGDRVLATYHPGCDFCDTMKGERRTFFPPHDASPRCDSGGRDHCTCDTCF